jgi:hypothetical protein
MSNTFNARKGLNIGPVTADPSSPVNGTIIYRSDLNKFRKYENGAWSDLSPAAVSVVSKTANYTLTTTDSSVLGSASGGAFTFTLPTAVGAIGKTYTLTRIDQTLANIITINTTSSQTIGAFGTSVTLATQDESWTVYSDGANWQVASHTIPSVWVSYTPTFTGFTGPTSEGFFWKRCGDSIDIKGTFTVGTANATVWSVSIVSGLTIDASKNTSTTNSASHGNLYSLGSSATVVFATSARGPFPIFSDTAVSNTLLYAGNSDLGARFNKDNASTIAITGGRQRVEVRGVPISNWF